MNLLDTFVILVFILKLCISILFQLKTFQDKEYRLDRLGVYFTSDYFKLFLSSSLLISTLILASKFIFNDLVFLIFTLIYIAFSITSFIFEVYEHRIQRPKFTARIFLMGFLSITFIIGFVAYFVYVPNLSLTLIDYSILFHVCNAAIIIFTLLALILTSIGTYPFKLIEINNAKKKFYLYKKNLLVIGITGSYAKSSMKELLYTMLSTKFQTITNYKNENTLIGIARMINNQLSKDTQIMVVEAGAYKRGEVKRAMNIAKPMISVLTGINEQHIELFGGIENTKKAKYEIIEALDSKGIAVFNADDANVKEVMQDFEGKKVGYSLSGNDLKLISFTNSKKGQEVEISHKNKKYKFTFKLLGKHNILNLLGAIQVSIAAGMKVDEIIAAIPRIEQKEKALELKKTKSGIMLIDDSYSTNPDGFVAALDVLNSFPQKRKVVFTSGFLEINNDEQLYKDIFADIDTEQVEIFTQEKDLYKQLRSLNLNVKYTSNIKKQRLNFDQNSAILIEGRIRQDIYTQILNQ